MLVERYNERFTALWDAAIHKHGAGGHELRFELPRGKSAPMRRGEGEGVYLLREGYFKLEVVRGTHRPTLRLCGPGELVGYGSWLLEGALDYHLTALSRGLLSFFPRAALQLLQRDCPDINSLVIHTLCRTILIKDERIVSLEQNTARDRVRSVLHTLARQFGEHSAGGVLLAVPVDRATLAGLASVSKENLSRILTDLAEAGLIVRQRRKLLVPDMQRLSVGPAAPDLRPPAQG